jgi:hypothetical protein
MRGASSVAGREMSAAMPMLVSMPLMWKQSLMETGRPCKGPMGRPVRWRYASSSRARWTARSKRGSVRQRVSWCAMAAL